MVNNKQKNIKKEFKVLLLMPPTYEFDVPLLGIPALSAFLKSKNNVQLMKY